MPSSRGVLVTGYHYASRLDGMQAGAVPERAEMPISPVVPGSRNGDTRSERRPARRGPTAAVGGATTSP